MNNLGNGINRIQEHQDDTVNTTNNTYKFANPLIIGLNDDGNFKYLNSVSFREPTAGDLRGLSLMKIFESDVDSWLILLSRITLPRINMEFLNKMSLTDTPNIIAKILGLLGNEARVEDTQAQ